MKMFDKLFDKIDSLLDGFSSKTTVSQSYVKSVSDAEYDVDINWSNTRGEDGNVILSIGEQLVNVNYKTYDGTYNIIVYYDGTNIIHNGCNDIDHSSINWIIKYKVDVKTQ